MWRGRPSSVGAALALLHIVGTCTGTGCLALAWSTPVSPMTQARPARPPRSFQEQGTGDSNGCRPLCANSAPNNDNNNNDNCGSSSTAALARASQLITADPSKSLSFSAAMTLCGAALGPFLDSYHSLFGVLSYDEPLTAHLWGSGSATTPDLPALVTAWWVPGLFGLAGFLIGWLYVLLDGMLQTAPAAKRHPSWPLVFVGISLFTAQYWLSGVLFANGVDRTTILNVMSLLAATGFAALDRTEAGLWTSVATAVGGPVLEVGLITVLVGHGGYHYNDLGSETGYFPLWIVPVYFLGGPAVGNLARGFWQILPGGGAIESADAADAVTTDILSDAEGPRCNVCNDTRATGCPNCDAQGYYITYGRRVSGD